MGGSNLSAADKHNLFTIVRSGSFSSRSYSAPRPSSYGSAFRCSLPGSPPARSRSSSTGRTAASATAKAATTYHPKAPAAAGAFPYPALQNPETPRGTGQPISARKHPLPDRPGKQRGVSSTRDRSQKTFFFVYRNASSLPDFREIGRASCRERVCLYV